MTVLDKPKPATIPLDVFLKRMHGLLDGEVEDFPEYETGQIAIITCLVAITEPPNNIRRMNDYVIAYMEERGWMFIGHDFVAGGIEYAFDRLEDDTSTQEEIDAFCAEMSVAQNRKMSGLYTNITIRDEGDDEEGVIIGYIDPRGN